MSVTSTRPLFTIERLRTLVLIGGGLLVVAVAVFLGVGQWKLRQSFKDLPGRLGVNIEQSADGVNYTQTRKGKTIFKIHAAKAVKRKDDGSMQLHDVRIELYGEDGIHTDTISGSEFEYNTNLGKATAAGAVEITLMRPGVKPAIAQLKPGSKPKPKGETAVPAGIADSQIHVKTSGLVFDQKSGVASTTQRVDFTLQQGAGNAVGASYDSAKGQLILDHSVELNVDRLGSQSSKGPVTVLASHAEFERESLLCRMTEAQAAYTGGNARIASATIHFRDDGSVVRLEGAGGVDLATAAGGHMTAPTGALEFDESNHPRHGLLSGGARLEMTETARHMEGTSPSAQLTFDRQGQLQLAHLGEGVVFNSEQQATAGNGKASRARRSWKSQTADIAFAAAERGVKPQVGRRGSATGKVEPRTIHGFGGVVVTSETASDGITTPSRLAAETVVAELAAGGALSSLSGTGHASFEERTATGAHQTSSADQLDVRFVSGALSHGKASAAGASEISTVTEVGHVVLTQDAPAGASQKGRGQAVPSAVQATANRADYDGASQVLHLTGDPRVRDGELDMTAESIDFARSSGDAFAHGDVRASWTGSGKGSGPVGSARQPGALPGASLLAGGAGSGGNGPIHAVAPEAELHQATQEVIFRGGSSGKTASAPRLWQAANSVSAPRITLNRQTQTLSAEGSGAANPVRTTLVSDPVQNSRAAGGTSKTPSVIRVRSGDLHYAESDRIALFGGGAAGVVTVETAGKGGAATVTSQDARVQLMPAGGQPATPKGSENTSVDRITAHGHVTVDWPDRKGTGETLVYRGADGKFTLTGTAAAPPRITDQARGTVTGSALIFDSRDDSVTVEGDGGKTVTETHSAK